MNNMKTLKGASRRTSWKGTRALPLLGMLMILGGCASSGTQRSVESLPDVDQAAIKRIREHVVAESKKLSDAQDALRQELIKPKQEVVLPMAEPKLDPLEARTISISMNNATISQLVVALADQSQLNLIVDPAVLAMDKRADLHLKNVTLREAVNNVLQAFDLVGQIKGNTLRVDLLDERIFALDFLNTATNLDISAGGNVFGATTGGSGGSSGSNALRGNVTLSGGSNSKGDPYEQIENAVKRIVGETRSRNSENDVDTKAVSTYSLDKLSGTLYVKARPSQVRSIEKLVDRTGKVFKRQVQIEAQLVDVQLSDGFQLGVDWNILRNQVAASYGNSPISLSSITSTLPLGKGALGSRTVTIPESVVGSATDTALGLAFQSNSFAVALDALRSFGNVKVLSNPSVQVRNGTPALLTVGTNSRYISKTTVTVTASTSSTTSSEVQTDSVFGGVMVGVVPFIRDDGNVELMVHPMQTDVEETSLKLVDAGNGAKVTLPVVSYKGMTTTLHVSDGDTVLIGGLIDQRTSNTDKGAPGLSDVPGLGWAFGNQKKSHSSRELVMVLRVRVL